MVREFTELQGVMGGIYAREAGEPEAVWKAIYHHYLPVAVEAGGAPSPEALGAARATWACVSLADKLDTLVGLFLAGERPTGSRDPYGLRRQAHGIVRILADAGAGVHARVGDLVGRAAAEFAGLPGLGDLSGLPEFFYERLQHVFEARGSDRRNVRAVLAERGAGLAVNVADLQANLLALAEFSRSEQFRQLATAFKRVRNIARELTVPGEFDAWDKTQPALDAVLKEPAEKALLKELASRAPKIEGTASGGTFREAYAEAAGFEPVVARFFTEIFVMADDETLKTARLRLLKRLERLILHLGDISEIVTESQD